MSESAEFLVAAKDAASKGDFKSAIAILTDAVAREAPEGAAAAAFSLGIIYDMNGEFSDKDAALKFYSMAEEGGVQEANYRIAGILYKRGDRLSALSRFKKAADHDPSAAYWCARILSAGNKDDIIEGYMYREKAAELAHIFAKREIILDRIKGREGFSRIPSAIVDFFKLITETGPIVSKGNKKLYE